MIDIKKHLEFFDPVKVTGPVHIVGCGAIGSHIAEMLIRLGVDNLTLWDFDTVEPYNIANQMYRNCDIGQTKLNALALQLKLIDPQVHLTLKPNGWAPGGVGLRGYVFLCVDSVGVRRAIIEENKLNPGTIAFFDFRMRLADAQHYAYPVAEADTLLKTMDFTQAEADAATPVSACGTTLSVLPTVRIITAVGVANFINFIKTGKMKKLILIDAFDFDISAC